ncbi:hypothetical protein CDAR_577061, partial [Caerostris darwini]
NSKNIKILHPICH